MSTLVNFSIDLNKVPKTAVTSKNGKAYLNLTMSVNDETKFGNNTSISIRQTKEQRTAKEKKEYIGNGQVVWTDGNVVLAEQEDDNRETKQLLVQSQELDSDFLDF